MDHHKKINAQLIIAEQVINFFQSTGYYNNTVTMICKKHP